MSTVNKRVFCPEASTINSIACGGTSRVQLQAGYDNIIRSAPDGLQFPVEDRECQFVRGSVTIDDWPDAISLLTGTVGTLVFYERKSGTAAATGYIKHTITNPKIYRISLRITKGGYASVSFDFECMFAAETSTINDAWAITDAQAAPTYITSARGGWRVSTALHGAVSILHVTELSLEIAIPVLKACNDADLGYTAVDLAESRMSFAGSIGFQDATITTAQLHMNKLLVTAAANLVITVVQSRGATSKVITIANVQFGTGSQSAGGNEYSGFSLPFGVNNNPTTPLTLAGANKIVTIADAA